MSILTTLKYKQYASKIISTGEDFRSAADKFVKNIEKTIPRHFNGRSANKAMQVAIEIADSMRNSGTSVRSYGYSVKRIADNTDID